MDMTSFEDWEKWARLAREDPEKFEQERAAAIEELIMSQPEESRHHSRQLQWKIDAIRQTSPNSLASCLRLYDMLLESVYGSNGLVEAFNLLCDRTSAIGRDEDSVKRTGQVLEFRAKEEDRKADPASTQSA